MKKNLKVYIADDHHVVRTAISRLIKTFARVAVVKEAMNGKELLKLVSEDAPDAVLLDIEMPVMGGIEAAKQLLQHFPKVKILMLTMHNEQSVIERVMELGIHGFLTKSADVLEVEKALYAILENDFYKSEWIEKARSRTPRLMSQKVGVPLTDREMEVLLLLCQDCSADDISRRLNISKKTFFNHRASIIHKTGAKGVAGLIKYSSERGWFKV